MQSSVEADPGSSTLAEIVIEACGLVRHFGRTRALDGLDLTVRSGQVFGLLGNNGAGKTTTIHVLLGLLASEAGEARVLGLDPTVDRLELAQRVGFFPESDQPYDWIKLAELLRLGELAFRDWNPGVATRLVERFELPNASITEMSKGMVAKTKLVLALGHRPECLILDEPTSGLDPGSRHELLRLIADVAGRDGTTTLFSSHNLDDVERIATHIGIIQAGRMVLTASRQAIGRMGILAWPKDAGPIAGSESWGLATRRGGDLNEWLVTDRESPRVTAFLGEVGAEVSPVDLPKLFLFATDRRTIWTD